MVIGEPSAIMQSGIEKMNHQFANKLRNSYMDRSCVPADGIIDAGYGSLYRI